MSDGKRVWIFSDVYPPAVFGAAFMTEAWREQLSQQGYRVRVFHPSGSLQQFRTPEHVGYRTIRNLAYAGDYHARFSTFVQLAKAKGELPDAILVSTPGRVGLLGLAIGSRYQVPTVLVHSTDLIAATDYHNPVRPALALTPKVIALAAASGVVRKNLVDLRKLLPGAAPGNLGARFTAHAMGSAYSDADELITLSSKRVDQIEQWVPGTPITVLPCGVDRLPESTSPVDLNWPAEGLRLINVGRMAPEKNLPLLVEAVGVAKQRGLEVQLTFVGEGEMADPLQKLAAERGLADRVRVMGPYRRNELRSVYAGAHVFGFPSTFDTQGFVLNEAAHEGVPLLLSDAEVNLVAQDGVSGLIVPSTAEGFADGLEKLAAPTLREKLGEGARKLAATLDEASQSVQLAEIIERAIAKHQGARV